MYHILLIHSSTDRHLSRFYYLVVISNAVRSIYVQFLYRHVFILLGFITRSGITGSYGNSIFNFLWNFQSVFSQVDRTILHSH